ncbi:MAG: hypothetical protein VX944_13590 [Myxococcota bacterium]|nr:hypothetical protein [Myxococcota bacterium]
MSKQFSLGRRKFVAVTGTGVVALSLGCVKKRDASAGAGAADSDATDPPPVETDSSDDSSSDSGGDSGGSGSVVAPDSGAPPSNECTATASDIEGPFWRDGIPIRSNLDLYGDAGTALTVTGVVQDAACVPIRNAVIEVWHADPTVLAASELDASVPSHSVDYDRTSDRYKYYGQFASDSEGRYTFRTKKPGWYLNGSQFRPAHIHLKVYVDGVERLTSQLYFGGDPFIPSDPWASAAPDRTIALASNGSGGLDGAFDIVVA